MNAHDPAAGEDHELVPGVAAITRSITHAVVIKEEDIFFLAESDGSVPLSTGHGFGLYYHDCRFLGGYELRMGGKKPEALVRHAVRGNAAVFGLSNPSLRMADGTQLLKHQVEIKWSRVLSSEHLVLNDTFRFHSLSPRPIDTQVKLTFQAGFEDIFAIRGLFQSQRGQTQPPQWDGKTLCFGYDGADGIKRSLTIAFDSAPVRVEGMSASFELHLEPKECWQLRVSLRLAESPADAAATPSQRPGQTFGGASQDTWGQFYSDNRMLNLVMERSLRDLDMLRSHIGGTAYFAAGVPWFVALFGRDSIITALQTLALNPRIAEDTIRLLARYQGTEVNPWREEEPGKILHELRVGEMARLKQIPHTPYYGTVDATPLWLVLLGRHAAWTGRLDLFLELKANIEAALNWLDRYGDVDGDGYIEYQCRIEKGLTNQGWKDSGDCIVNADGSLATPPITLVELQGYTYQAKLEMAALYHKAGEPARASALELEAQRLCDWFNRDFWVAEGYYALALHEGKRQAAVLSSNAGHALWSGIASMDKALQTASHLMSPEMFNGWGIRTLSAKELAYNPLGYHLGTVWPHDNALIADGFRRYGYDEAALRVFGGMMDAAMHFDDHRLPELFGGFHREDYGVPVDYPVACQPQAWAAGTFPYLLTTLLGLQPQGFDNRLKVVRPVLPEHIKHVELRGIQVGKARADLLFENDGKAINVKVLKLDGELGVTVEL